MIFRFLTAPVTALFMVLSVSAHDWHRHAEDPDAPFSIPASEGSEPSLSEAIAVRTEAFAAYHPDVRVSWDDTWFYNESDGTADHEMMTGITSWQQQVPLAGASITAFARHGSHVFSLTYQLNGQSYWVDWSVAPDAGSVTFDFINAGGKTSQAYKRWESPPNTLMPSLLLSEYRNGLMWFKASGTANVSHPFSWSRNLQHWERFGFLPFDASGSAIFSLESADERGFLRVDAYGVSVSEHDELDP